MNGFLHTLIHDWPRWLRILLLFGGITTIFFVIMLVFVFQYNVDLKNGTLIKPEAASVKNCQTVNQAFITYNQGLNSRILAYQAQSVTLDRDIKDTGQKCLAEMPRNLSRTQRESGCSTPSRGLVNDFNYSGISGNYRQVLRDFADQKIIVQSLIKALEDQQTQERQRIIQICSKIEN